MTTAVKLETFRCEFKKFTK